MEGNLLGRGRRRKRKGEAETERKRGEMGKRWERKKKEKKPGDFENSPPLIPSFLSIHSIQGRNNTN